MVTQTCWRSCFERGWQSSYFFVCPDEFKAALQLLYKHYTLPIHIHQACMDGEIQERWHIKSTWKEIKENLGLRVSRIYTEPDGFRPLNNDWW